MEISDEEKRKSSLKKLKQDIAKSDAWSIIEINDEIHVVPYNKVNEEISSPHVLDAFCDCEPKITLTEDGILFYVHNTFH
jgi:hypothetical protein